TAGPCSLNCDIVRLTLSAPFWQNWPRLPLGSLSRLGDAMATALRPSELLEARLRSREAQVAVLGLGYAGLPMAVACAEAGYPVLGLDVDQARAAAVQAGVSPVTDVEDTVLGPLVARGRLRASTDMGLLDDADVALICV